MALVNAFRQSLSRLAIVPVRSKFSAAAWTALGIPLTLAGEASVQSGWAYYFPDKYELKAEQDRSELLERAEGVQEQVSQLEGGLAKLQGNQGFDQEAAEQFLSEAKGVVAELQAVPGDISDIADSNARFLQNGAGQYTNLTKATDFRLGQGEAITLCSERFNVGLDGSYTKWNFRGDNGRRSFAPGEGTAIEGDTQVLTLSFAGSRGEEAMYNFECHDASDI